MYVCIFLYIYIYIYILRIGDGFEPPSGQLYHMSYITLYLISYHSLSYYRPPAPRPMRRVLRAGRTAGPGQKPDGRAEPERCGLLIVARAGPEMCGFLELARAGLLSVWLAQPLTGPPSRGSSRGSAAEVHI